MKYQFNGKVEMVGDKGYIELPFNVWEVCQHRDVIQADVKIDGKHVDCQLMPEDKGHYKMSIAREALAEINLNMVHSVYLHVGGSLVKIHENSPYSTENPIRKIDHIEVIIQPEDGFCGQTCVAMLAGVTIDDVDAIMKCGAWKATMGMVISGLNYYGLRHTETIYYTRGEQVTLPKCCILMEKMGRFCHYLVHYDGKFYDSNLGVITEYDTTKLIGYLEVLVP